jgi:hypothetical protein
LLIYHPFPRVSAERHFCEPEPVSAARVLAYYRLQSLMIEEGGDNRNILGQNENVNWKVESSEVTTTVVPGIIKIGIPQFRTSKQPLDNALFLLLSVLKR